MPGVIGAGLRFAVPDILNLQSSDWTAANGAPAFGQNGEIFRVFYHAESASRAAGILFFPLTASSNSSAESRANLFPGMVVGTAASAVSSCLGIWARSVTGSVIGWGQNGGPATLTLSATGQITLGSAMLLPNATNLWEKTASTGISTLVGLGFIAARQFPIASTTNSASTAACYIIGGQ